MRTRELVKLKAQLVHLTGVQRRQLAVELQEIEGRESSLEVIETGTDNRKICPHCSGSHVVKNGTSHKLQRFLCRLCQKTFNALTGSPLLRLRRRDKWAEYAQALSDGLTLHRAAKQVGINIKTAFLWRHRFMSKPKFLMSQRLTGVAEIDETYFRRSFKGQRHRLVREPRHRGGTASSCGLPLSEQVPVLVACDRSGGLADFILEAHDSDSIVSLLRPLVARDAVLCTEGNSVMRATGRKLGIEHHVLNITAGRRVDGAWHVQNVNGYHSRLKTWMIRFKGVSTRYLDTYLGWHRTLDRSPNLASQPLTLLAMTI